MRKGWFGPKRIGYGISPKSWEGWVATLIFTLGVIFWPRLLHGPTSWLWAGWAGFSLLFAGVIALTYESDDY